MEDTETPRMHKYGENKTTQIMVAAVRHVTSSSGPRKFQADGFLLNRGLKAIPISGTDEWNLILG